MQVCSWRGEAKSTAIHACGYVITLTVVNTFVFVGSQVHEGLLMNIEYDVTTLLIMLSLYFVAVSPCIVFVQSTVSRFTLAILFMAIFLYDQCSAQICFHKKKKKRKEKKKHGSWHR